MNMKTLIHVTYQLVEFRKYLISNTTQKKDVKRIKYIYKTYIMYLRFAVSYFRFILLVNKSNTLKLF